MSLAATHAAPTGLFVIDARVYWEDTDAGGIVYYANYLRYLERARTEWLRAQGIGQRAMAAREDVLFSVVDIHARYRRPALLDDALVVSCEPQRAGGASFECAQRIWRGAVDGELLLTATVRIACIEASSRRPCRLPASVAALLPPSVP